MVDLIVRDVAEEMLLQLQRRAQQNSRSMDAEVTAILEDVLLREKYATITKEQGLGSALATIGREFGISGEFDNLREPHGPPHSAR